MDLDAPAGREPRRDIALEALRGIAAFIVVFWHLMLAFAPVRAGVYPQFDQSQSINGRFWFWILNGNASVDFFFVLSGYVLVRSALLTGDGTRIALAALKRWPRLAGPVTLACLFSWALFHAHTYRFDAAAKISGSPWLAQFANAQSIPGASDPITRPLAQGVYRTFFFGDQSYDSSLWTMRIEFLGSFVVFGLGLLVLHLKPLRPAAKLVLLMLAALLAFDVDPFYTAFVAGVALASLLPETPRITPLWAAVMWGLLALWLMGYGEQPRDFHFLKRFHGGPKPVLVHALASVILIYVVETTAALRRILQHRIIALLGRMSFPVYLVHIPILCSAGCAVYLGMLNITDMRLAVAAAAVTTILLTIVVALPLAAFDRWWVRAVSATVRRVAGASVPVPTPQSAAIHPPTG